MFFRCFLKVLKLSAFAISFGKLFHKFIIRIKKSIYKLFNLADLVFNLKQWLDLNDLNLSANMKRSWGSKPFSPLIVL